MFGLLTQTKEPTSIIPKKKITHISKAIRQCKGAVRSSIKCKNTRRTLSAAINKTKDDDALLPML
jgi:hypothetical protein